MISVVIPTFNNKKQLLTNLKNNIPFLKGCEVIIVNDDPFERLENDLKQIPNITLIENTQNLGFARTIHKGILRAGNNYVMLLNDDVVLHDDSYRKAYQQLQKDEQLFAISFAQKEKDGSIVGKNSIFWQNNFFQHKKADDISPGINGWAEGGACMLNKKLYKKIGGFDPLYSPFYWEDIDLSYRAWKAGYHILFDPEIMVTHHHGSTIGKKFMNKKINAIVYRNQFIFIWKNITDITLLSSHFICLLYVLPKMLFKDKLFVSGFFNAIGKIPRILYKKNKGIISDKEILKKFIPHS